MSSFDTWPPVSIAGTGSYVPERIVTNAELCETLDTSDEWIVSHTGIRERRWASADETTATLAARACERALQASACHAGDIDLIVLATSTPDWRQPATASAVHALLGLRDDAGAVDVNVVCSGFVHALHMAAATLAGSEAWTNVLVVGADHYSTITDPSDRTTRIFFGDGAGAVVLRKEFELADLAVIAAHEAGMDVADLGNFSGIDGGVEDAATPGLRSVAYTTTNASSEALRQPHDGWLHMDGPGVKAFAIPALVNGVRTACRDAGVTVDDVQLIVPHQSNRRMLEAAIDELGLPEGRLAITVDDYGNTAAASIPLTLDEAVRAGRLSDGDLVVLAGYGGGLSSAACVVAWSI